jgi:predicted Zn-dependent protease
MLRYTTLRVLFTVHLALWYYDIMIHNTIKLNFTFIKAHVYIKKCINKNNMLYTEFKQKISNIKLCNYVWF